LFHDLDQNSPAKNHLQQVAGDWAAPKESGQPVHFPRACLLRFRAYIVLAEKEMTLANSKDTPKRIEVRFKKEERGREGVQAMLEYEAEGRAVREKTARLRALRLAAEAVAKDAEVKAAANHAEVKAAANRVKGSVKKAAGKVTGGAKLKAKGKVAKAVGKEFGSKKDALTNTFSA
jgi:uncharacterized protein YjbJ (UPF0337 family)